MQYPHDLHGITAYPIQDPMTFADQASNIVSESRPCFATIGIQRQALERMIDGVLIGVGGLLPKLRSAIIANFFKISVSRPAQYDLSHAGRDVLRLSP